MNDLKHLITAFVKEASFQHSFLTETNYKPLDLENIGTPESAFFKLSSDEMFEELKKKFKDKKKACAYIDFYVKRSLEYMEDKDILKFTILKKRLLNS